MKSDHRGKYNKYTSQLRNPKKKVKFYLFPTLLEFTFYIEYQLVYICKISFLSS